MWRSGPTVTLHTMFVVGMYLSMILWGLELAQSNERQLQVQQEEPMNAPLLPTKLNLLRIPLIDREQPLEEMDAPLAGSLSVESDLGGGKPSAKEELDTSLTILSHELPGYTGWARPIYTLVDYFEIVSSTKEVTVGHNWTVAVHCKHPAASKGGSLFYIRAFGRALLPGTVEDHKNGTYTIAILPHDPGIYTLEVVLTFSVKPPFHHVPTPENEKLGDPSYEGFLLPGFPIQIRAAQKQTDSASDKQQQLPSCSAKQLIETSPNGPLETGRWLVTSKTRSTTSFPSNVENYQKAESINMDNYRNGKNALGIHMDYFYDDCSVLSYDDMTSKQKWLSILNNSSSSSTKNIHILYVGDSNTRNQFNFFRDHVGAGLGKKSNYKGDPSKLVYLDGRLKVTYLNMMALGNWKKAMDETKSRIQQLTADPNNQNDSFYIQFNAGLHIITRARRGFYTTDILELVQLLKSVPASLRVWQNTVAAWPKWGVFGVAWPQAAGQKFPKEPNFCGYINEMAWKAMQEAHIPVMDTYWLTLSRPDHREVVRKDDQRTSYKLVHLGTEAYSFLVRKFVHMIFEAVQNGEPHVPYL